MLLHRSKKSPSAVTRLNCPTRLRNSFSRSLAVEFSNPTHSAPALSPLTTVCGVAGAGDPCAELIDGARSTVTDAAVQVSTPRRPWGTDMFDKARKRISSPFLLHIDRK